MELDAAIEIMASTGDKVEKMHSKMMKPGAKPIRKPVGNSLTQGASVVSPVFLKINDTPAVGKMWFVKKVALFGTDGHTAVTYSGTNPTPAQPAVPASTVAVQNTNAYPVNVVISAGTLTAVVVNGITVGTGDGTYLVPVAGAISITYSVAPTWVWSDANPLPVLNTIVDIYAGPLEEVGGSPITDFSAQLVPGAVIPSITRFGRFDEPIESRESIYAIIYNLQANQQIVLVAEIDEWLVSDQEAMAT